MIYIIQAIWIVDKRKAIHIYARAKRELAYRIDAHETACPECYNREPLNPKPRTPTPGSLARGENYPTLSLFFFIILSLLRPAKKKKKTRFHPLEITPVTLARSC